MSERITQVYGRVLGQGRGIKATQVVAKAMIETLPRQRVTQVGAQAMVRVEQDDTLKVTQAYRQVMFRFAPNFDWIEMFINEVFPYDISENSMGATRFQTDVIMVDSGHDQRQSRWDQPLMEYDVAYGVRTMEHLQGLIAFFRAMGGKKHAFLYKDHMDFQSSQAIAYEARRAPPIQPTDQAQFIGDAKTFQFQLIKTYRTPGGGASQVRPIYKPKDKTVRIALNGLEIDKQFFDVDLMRGKVTLKPQIDRTISSGISMTSPSTGVYRVTGAANLWQGYAVGDRVCMSGWVNTRNNVTLDVDVRIVSMASDRSWANLSGPSTFGGAESNVSGVRIYQHPAPRSGVAVTAGYEFYVPVRFDTDRLPVELEYYGIGGAADVKLIEVRPHEE